MATTPKTQTRVSGPSAKANVAKMVIGGASAPEADTDLSYLDCVEETAPEGTTVIDAVEVKTIPNPAAQIDPAENSGQQANNEQPPVNEQPEPVANNPADDEIDDPAYKGKSRKDLYEEMKKIRSEYGRQSNEVGDYRKFFDQFTAQMAKQQPINQPATSQQLPVNGAKPVVDDSQMLELMLGNPSEFVKKIEEGLFQKIQGIGVRSQIEQIDLDNKDLSQDQNFLPWIANNISQQMLQLAEVDPKTRLMIISHYRQHAAASSQPAIQQPITGNGSAPSTGTKRVVTVPAAAAGAGTPAGRAPVQTFSRKAMRQLAFSDPAKYKAIAADYTRAINEGRVTD